MDNQPTPTQDTVFVAHADWHGDDGKALQGVFKTLEGAKLACGDADRYSADDEDGDDKLVWTTGDDQLWSATSPDTEIEYTIECVPLSA